MRATQLIVCLFLTLTACPRNLGPSGPADGYNLQCVASFHQGDLVQARVLCEHCLEFKPDHAECLTNLGLVLRQQGDVKGAKASLIKAVRANPDMAQAYNDLGVIELDEGNTRIAKDRFTAALRLNPDYAEARSNLGLAQFRANELDDAERTYRHLIASAPMLSEPYVNLGAIELLRGRPAEAVPWFEKALSLEPDYLAAWKGLCAARAALDPKDVECLRGDERTR